MGVFTKTTKPSQEEIEKFIYDLEDSIRFDGEFMGCCGIDVAYGFEDIPESDFVRFKSTVKSWLKDNLTTGVAIQVIALNDKQKAVKDIIEELGFKKLISGFNNAYKGNRIDLYGKTISSRRRR